MPACIGEVGREGPGGTRWGFVILASTKAPPLGATLADKSPLIPCTEGGVAVGKWGMEENGANGAA